MTPTAIVLGGLAVILGFAVVLLLVRALGSARALSAGESREAALAADAGRLTDALAGTNSELDSARRQVSDLAVERARLIERLEAAAKHRTEYEAALKANLEQAHKTYKEMIDASAGEALKGVSKDFREWAKQNFEGEQKAAREAIDSRIKPIDETLKKTEAKLGEIEKERLGAYERLATHMKQVGEFSESLRKETGNLVAALRKPQVRGRYGEVQLRRVAELAGMRSYCDFTEQATARDDAGALKQPDMVVKLPNGRCVVVDAKTNIEAYIDAIEAPDEVQRDRHLDRFAKHVADQASALSKKEYWSQFAGAADLVVMFVPGDQFIDAALQRRPELLELAAENGIIFASPSTLIGLLRAVYVGWREKNLSDRANELFDLGKELHGRMAKVLEDFVRLGKKLDDASGAYNEAVASVDSRLMPTLRRFEEAGARSEKTLPEPVVIDAAVRAFKSLPASEEAVG